MSRTMNFHCDFCGALIKEASIKVVSGKISSGSINDAFDQLIIKLDLELCPECHAELLGAIAGLKDYINRRDRRQHS